MITSRFPIWRTNPAGFGVSGYWPVLTGALAIMIVVPLLGFLLSLMGAALTPVGSPASRMFDSLAIVLAASPIFTWAIMLVAIPVSGWAAAKGFAGWGVALAGGVLAALLTELILSGRLRFNAEFALFLSLGMAFGAVYWLAIRLIHPTAIGVAFDPPST